MLDKKNIKDIYPLTPMQEGMLFHSLYDKSSYAYFEQFSYRLHGTLEIPLINRSLNQLLKRYDVLRTVFIHKDVERPLQVVLKERDIDFSYKDISQMETGDEKERFLMDLKQKDRQRFFDLSKDVLMRVAVIRVDKDEYEFIWSFHHILIDGWCLGILISDYFEIYNSFLENRAYRLSEVKPYRDYILWLEKQDKKEAANYWKKYLEGYDEAAGVPRLKTHQTEQYDQQKIVLRLEDEQTARLNKLAAGYRTSLNTVVQSAWGIILGRYSGKNDVVYGAVVSGRPSEIPGIESMIGLFINTIPIRIQLDNRKIYSDLLKTVQEKALESEPYQYSLLAEIQADSQLKQDLLDHILVFENYPDVVGIDGNHTGSSRTGKDINLKKVLQTGTFEQTNYDFNITVSSALRMTIQFSFNANMYDKEWVGKIPGHFKEVLRQVLDNEALELGDITLLTVEEKNELLFTFNDTETAFPHDKTLHQLFEEQVDKTPHKIVSRFEDKALTYKELDQQANRLMNYLYSQKSIQKGERVGVLMDRSLNILVAILGILKAGGAYVPIDSSIPEMRIKYIIDNAEIGVVLSEKQNIKVLNRLQWECKHFHTFLCMDSSSVYDEAEADKNILMDTEMWHLIGESAEDEITGGGWFSSYTGEPLSKEEMREYSDNIFRKLTPYLNKKLRVLEIGCATGISMYRIAPHVGFYYGTDISSVIIEKNRQQVKVQGIQNIALACLAAHEIDRLEEDNFDMVLINSVVHYFHGHNYLRKVIGKTIDKLGEKGTLFLGDLMDQDLKDDLNQEMREFKRAFRDKNVRTKTDWSAELFVSRGFLEDLSAAVPEIQHIEFSDKIHTIENELTKFRYDALLTIDKSKKVKTAHTPKKYQHDQNILEQPGSKPAAIQKDFLPQPLDLAYVTYTSGTTGLPKGIMIEHRAVINFIKGMTDFIDFTEKDRILSLTTISFDIFGLEAILPVTRGAEVVLGNREAQLDNFVLTDLILKEHISIFQLTPSRLDILLLDETLEQRRALKLLKYLLVGGETFPEALLDKVSTLTAGKIYNLYGPTETTIWSTIKDVTGGSALNIGKPIANTQVYILAKTGQLTPVGVTGELCIGGKGLARGYLNNPELTIEKFFSSSLLSFSASQLLSFSLYRTGDLARWLPDGNIEFSGRIDHQVKIRGFRIETGEIENQLMEMGDVNQAVVIDRIDEGGEKYLCAYLVSDFELDIAETRKALLNTLPDYMIPAYFIRLENIPLTPNGKINRAALPAPGMEGKQAYTAPRNKREDTLTKIWSEVLGIKKDKIGIDVNFFEIGGHSLKATLLASRVHKELNIKIPLTEIFKIPTVKGLANYIGKVAQDTFHSIEKAEKKEYYPLSPAQKRLYILHRMDENSTQYNMPMVLKLEGTVNQYALEDTFKKLIQRHESLRTSFDMIGDEPVQMVHPFVGFKIEYDDTGSSPGVEEIVKNFSRGFDLSRAPLLRVGLLKKEKQTFILMLDMHHIITDGVSGAVLTREFISLYGGKKPAPMKLHYKDYSEWLNRETIKELLDCQKEYWLKEFEGELPVLRLPADYSRPVVHSFEGSLIHFEIGPKEAAGLMEIGRSHGATLFMVLLALYNIFLSRLSSQEDIIVGLPIAGRRHTDLENIIGMFVNSLALRNAPASGKVFTTFLDEVREKTLQAFDNQDYPFEELVENAAVHRDTSRNPLFDVMLVLQNIFETSNNKQETGVKKLKITPYPHEHQTSKFDLTLAAVEIEGKLSASFEYSTRLFREQTILRFIDYFKKVISSVTGTPGIKISDIEIISEEEKKQLLYDSWNREAVYPADKTIHRLFEEQAARTPDRVAVIGIPDQLTYRTYKTYKQLEKNSNRLADQLQAKGVKHGAIVGIMVERSLEMIVGILGILKAGGAYMPIDPDYPEERINYILADSSTKTLLSAKDIDPPQNYRSYRSYSPADAANPAYVIYTSGTSGTPKGVLIEHRNVVSLFFNDKFQFDFNETDVWTMFHSYCFDFSVWEMYGALLYGGKLVVIPKMAARDAHMYLEILKKQNITILNQTPSAFYHLINLELEHPGKELNIRTIIFGGEALYPAKLKEWKAKYPGTKLVNMYGITETTVHVTFKQIEDHEITFNTCNIGKAIPTLYTYVMDNCLKLVPTSVKGELLVGGDGVGRGYLNQPELTGEKFVKNPYKTGERCYRSGDLAKLSAHGELEYLGRIDFQAKIRGFRIEVGEIENQLLKHKGIKETVVAAKESDKGDKYLCAYIVARSMEHGAWRNITELREYLAQRLPDYMVPAYFVALDKIPLTSNGKVDRKALPEPEIKAGEGYIAPRDPMEEKLVELWSEVLGIKKDAIGIDANFFELGGHSLKATILVTKIHKELNVKLLLVEIFTTPTIRGLAAHIRGLPGEMHVPLEPVEEKEYYPLSPAQSRLYIIQQMDLNSIGYNIPIVVELEGYVDMDKLEEAFGKLIQRHESLRTSFLMIEEEPVQKIYNHVEFEIERFDLNAGRGEEKIINGFIKAFDLAKAPLLRVGILNTGDGRQIMMVDMHHIVTDGVSQGILLKDFLSLYSGRELPPLRLHYKDYSEWQHHMLEAQFLKKQEEYWLNRFKGDIPVLHLPSDYPKQPDQTSYEGNAVRVPVDEELSAALYETLKGTEITTFMFLLAVYNVLLSKYTRQTDIIVVSPIAGRRHIDFQNIIGMFVNMLAIRNQPEENKTFRQFLEEVKKSALDAFENQDYQFMELVRRLGLQGKMGRSPLLNTVFTMQNLNNGERDIDALKEIRHLKTRPYEYNREISVFDLHLVAFESNGILELTMVYSSYLFKHSTVQGISRHYIEILNQVLENPDIKLKEIKMSYELVEMKPKNINDQLDFEF